MLTTRKGTGEMSASTQLELGKMAARLLKGICLRIEEEKIELENGKVELEKRVARLKSNLVLEGKQLDIMKVVQEVLISELTEVVQKNLDDAELKDMCLRIEELETELTKEKNASAFLLTLQAELKVKLESARLSEQEMPQYNQEYAADFDRMKEATEDKEDQHVKVHFKMSRQKELAEAKEAAVKLKSQNDALILMNLAMTNLRVKKAEAGERSKKKKCDAGVFLVKGDVVDLSAQIRELEGDANTLISKLTQEKKSAIQQSNKLREELRNILKGRDIAKRWLLMLLGMGMGMTGTSGKILDTPLEFLEEFSQQYLYGSTLNLNAKVKNFIHNNNWVVPTNAVYDLDFIWENINDIASHQGENDEVVWTVSAKVEAWSLNAQWTVPKPATCKWLKPPTNCYALNTDGSLGAIGGCRAILRHWEGDHVALDYIDKRGSNCSCNLLSNVGRPSANSRPSLNHIIFFYFTLRGRPRSSINIFSSYLMILMLSTTEKQFLYDIVANGRNGIDVDK
ncbi:hypothetical protein GIB67_027839 [Kingdonia uniflora]|uniref:Uncharacterized protein n=1 Tax=Kingdonia uniflora TaxID=39325 RepID=A0A7J7P5B4_9MAGN|nr:hypothetical protein GIB67_027839 [Kingdonia uniflora]